MMLEERMETVRFVVDARPHIELNKDICSRCSQHPCTRVCPAGCYSKGNEIIEFQYEGCLECGTCRTVCPHRAITWEYPRGGYGVCYRLA